MAAHLSPKAEALTLPLNWSQFLKTLIGAENYTLFQLPPPRTRPASALRAFNLPSPATLCCLPFSSRSLPIPATRIFLFPPRAIARNIDEIRDGRRDLRRDASALLVGRLRARSVARLGETESLPASRRHPSVATPVVIPSLSLSISLSVPLPLLATS